jgi:hypothetical protein
VNRENQEQENQEKEGLMAYDDNGRLRSEDELRANDQGVEVKSNFSYIIGGLVALAVILGVIILLPHSTDTEAVNGRPATTTGAGATAPNSINPTRPAPPATPGAPATR